MLLQGVEVVAQWRWPHFSIAEMKCKHCNETKVDPVLMDKMEELRIKFGKPIIINSGYRCSEHNNRVSHTGLNGPHTMGAIDIGCSGSEAHKILCVATELEFRGIGINQKGAGRFIHLDMLTDTMHPRPWVWSY